MPLVGKKKFPYSKAGKAEAKKYASAKKRKVKVAPRGGKGYG